MRGCMFRSISWATCIWANPKLRPLFVNCLLSSSLMFVNCLLLPPVSSQSPAHQLVNFGSGDLDALSWPCTIPNSEHRMKTLPCLISLQVLGSHWPQSFLYTVHPLRLRVAVWPYLNLSQDFLRTLSLFCAMCTWSLVCILTHRILKWSVFAFCKYVWFLWSFYPPLSELTRHKSWFCKTSALIPPTHWLKSNCSRRSAVRLFELMPAPPSDSGSGYPQTRSEATCGLCMSELHPY